MLNNDRMESRNLAIGIALSLQSALGILGNISFLFYYLLLYYSKGTLKTVDLILTHVFTANSLIILSKGILQITGAFEWNQLFSDVGCKLIFYILRLGRSMSISTICLLSVFQAITISPKNSCWKNFIVKTPRFMGFSISLFWILHMLMNLIFCLYPSTEKNSKNMTQKSTFELCSSSPGHDTIIESLYMVFWVLPEILFSVLLVSSSSFMIITLSEHKKQVQHIHSSHYSPRTSPESRATWNILVLICTFLVFYSLSSILQSCIVLSRNSSWWIVNITALISMCFPTLGPFIMNHDITISKMFFLNKKYVNNNIIFQ